MGDYRRLKVYERAHEVALAVYEVTEGFPVTERYGLVSQLRRAAVSVPANLVEGMGRLGDRELARFAVVARASAKELDYLLLLSADLSHLRAPDYHRLAGDVDEVCRMLSGLIRRASGSAKRSGSRHPAPTRSPLPAPSS